MSNHLAFQVRNKKILGTRHYELKLCQNENEEISRRIGEAEKQFHRHSVERNQLDHEIDSIKAQILQIERQMSDN